MTYAYTSKTAVQNYLKRNIDSSFDTQLTAYIEAMSDYADTLAGYPIYREDPETRTYDGNAHQELAIDPVNSITEVIVDEVTLTADDYVAQPYNNSTKTRLVLKSGVFTPDLANVTVEGTHALKAELSESVKWAVTVLVALIVNNVDNQTDGVQSEKVGEYQVSFRNQQDRNDYKLAVTILSGMRPISF